MQYTRLACDPSCPVSKDEGFPLSKCPKSISPFSPDITYH